MRLRRTISFLMFSTFIWQMCEREWDEMLTHNIKALSSRLLLLPLLLVAPKRIQYNRQTTDLGGRSACGLYFYSNAFLEFY
jgi:hypothetical protein